MNKKEIGTNAGIIWNLLNDFQRWDIPKLCKACGLSEKEVYAAIGWLAREDKIETEQSTDGKDSFYLLIDYYI